MLGAITGGIAEAYYGIPKVIQTIAITYLDSELNAIILEFENKYQKKR